MNTVLVISIGQSPDPCFASVQQHSAGRVIFFASQETRGTVTDIERLLERRGELVALEQDDEYDFGRCYKTAREAIRKALDVPEPRRIVVDITGGTKTMTAALALAASDHQLEFAYVVSEKHPDGKFKHNSEKVKPFANPLHTYHTRELERLQSSFNAGDFRATLETIKTILERSQNDYDKRFYTELERLVKAFEAWDLFDHSKASDMFQKALRELKTLSDAKPDSPWHAWIRQLEALQPELEQLKMAKKEPSMVLLQDLLANADRRIERGEYDDAVARLYRAVGLYLEILLTEAGVKIEETRYTLPEKAVGVMQKFREHQRKGRNVLELSSIPDMAKLAAQLEPHKGAALWRSLEEGKLGSILKKRNQSILAHGVQPIGKELAEGLRHALLEEFDLQSKPIWMPMPKLI